MNRHGLRRAARGSASVPVLLVIIAVLLGLANCLLAVVALTGGTDAPALQRAWQEHSLTLVGVGLTPLLMALLAAALRGTRGSEAAQPAARPSPEPAPPPRPSPAPALRLLTLLQQEGRFVDFITEDIDGYSDEQVGAAVRSIHAGCRKALAGRVTFERIFDAADGTDVVVQPGFDPTAIRLTGNVTGTPPFRGTLQHGGWRAANVSLPESIGDADASVIAPAEVELP
jgi:hypothetical protein